MQMRWWERLFIVAALLGVMFVVLAILLFPPH
jgi:hypothetical protein